MVDYVLGTGLLVLCEWTLVLDEIFARSAWDEYTQSFGSSADCDDGVFRGWIRWDAIRAGVIVG